MLAYKLFKQRKDGTIGPLFINARQRVTIGEWLEAEEHPTKGFAVRPGWHCVAQKHAPHLSTKGRVWYVVEIAEFKSISKPSAQGEEWLLANKMRVIGPA